MGLALALGVHPKEIGSFVRFDLNAQQAEDRADAILSPRLSDLATYRRVATIQYTMDPLVNEYVIVYVPGVLVARFISPVAAVIETPAGAVYVPPAVPVCVTAAVPVAP